MSATVAPVALFAYRRPAHLARTLKSLLRNPEASKTEIFVFSDGAKSSSDSADVEAVRDSLSDLRGFAATHVICRKTNLGLARNITDGVSVVLGSHQGVIVVEDDIVVSPFFLRFMNDALRAYRDTPRVGSVSGYCYPVAEPVPETYFIRGSDCWGWATWPNRWRLFNPDSRALLAELEGRSLVHSFDFDGAMSFSQMLKDHIAGKNDSWAVRWHASCYLNDLLILYPGRSLAQNIGFDGTGTHCKIPDKTMDVRLTLTPVAVGKIPIEENTKAREAIRRFFISQRAVAQREASDAPPIASSGTQLLRRWAKRALPPLIYDLLRALRDSWLAAQSPRPKIMPSAATMAAYPFDSHATDQSWGLNRLDRQIEKYLDFDNGFFVEIGANDGRLQSNTFYYEQFRNWQRRAGRTSTQSFS